MSSVRTAHEWKKNFIAAARRYPASTSAVSLLACHEDNLNRCFLMLRNHCRNDKRVAMPLLHLASTGSRVLTYLAHSLVSASLIASKKYVKRNSWVSSHKTRQLHRWWPAVCNVDICISLKYLVLAWGVACRSSLSFHSVIMWTISWMVQDAWVGSCRRFHCMILPVSSTLSDGRRRG